MKAIKFIVALTGLALAVQVNAQWTGTSPSPLYTTTQTVGIGIATPSRTLHVQTGSSNGGIRVTQTTTGFSALELFNTSTGGRNWGLGSCGNINEMPGTFVLYDWTATKYRLVVDETGDVGIGMHASSGVNRPDQRLHVHNGAIKVSGTNGYGGPMILFGSNDVTTGLGTEKWGIEYTTAGTSGLNFWRPTIGNNYLFLNDNGNIGINTNNTTAKLTVNGTTLIGDPAIITSLPAGYKLYVQSGILTERVKVAVHTSSDWMDQVFAPDYKLLSLDSVETYIKDNCHLPDVPSADEVVKEGIDVAKMDALLLQKIEELTLYVIQLQKEIEKLKGE